MDNFEQQSGWCALTGQRTFKSANQAWEIYAQYRFSISKRNFLSYVGKGKPCLPRESGAYHVEDIELFSKFKGWPPAPAFVRGVTQGGEGGISPTEIEYGELYQKEKALKEGILREGEAIKLQKTKGELIPRRDYEQQLAAAAIVVGTSAETFVYDSVREIIHICNGDPAKEDDLREFMLHRVRGWLHAFSNQAHYQVDFFEDENSDEEAGLLPALNPDGATL